MLSSSKPKPKHRLAFQAIGTAWTIDIYDDVSDAAQVERAVHTLIEDFDATYSRFRNDSLVSSISHSPGVYKLPTNAQPMLSLYQELYALSDGEVTPLIGQTLSDAGYDADYSLRPKTLSSPPAWENALDYSFPKLTIKQPVLLDFGALGKGYLVDLVSDLLSSKGFTNFCVDASGDMHVAGTSQTVGLEDPNNADQVIGTASIVDQSLCGSAGNRRMWANFHHILSPSSRTSPQHIAAVWVTAANTLLADALTTALYFVAPEKLAAVYTFEYVIIARDGSFQSSAKFPGTIFTA